MNKDEYIYGVSHAPTPTPRVKASALQYAHMVWHTANKYWKVIKLYATCRVHYTPGPRGGASGGGAKSFARSTHDHTVW